MMDMTMGRRGVVWKTPDITADGLKIFACIAMLIQSIGIVVVERGMINLSQYTRESLDQALAGDSHLMMLAGIGSVMQIIGGMAMPVFTFLLVEGFRNTSSYKKYLLSVLAFALISEIPYDLAMNGKVLDFSSQNAMVSMVICLIMLYALDLFKEKEGVTGGLLKLCAVFAAVVWAALLRTEYGLCLVFLTAVFDIFYTRNVLKTFLGIIVSLMYVTGPVAFYGIWCYNGIRKDKIPKYVYYAFYPLHLLVLVIIAWFL